eukprot:5509895-Pleurochrysis_carterae.AAC.2
MGAQLVSESLRAKWQTTLLTMSSATRTLSSARQIGVLKTNLTATALSNDARRAGSSAATVNATRGVHFDKTVTATA